MNLVKQLDSTYRVARLGAQLELELLCQFTSDAKLYGALSLSTKTLTPLAKTLLGLGSDKFMEMVKAYLPSLSTAEGACTLDSFKGNIFTLATLLAQNISETLKDFTEAMLTANKELSTP